MPSIVYLGSMRLRDTHSTNSYTVFRRPVRDAAIPTAIYRTTNATKLFTVLIMGTIRDLYETTTLGASLPVF